LSLEELQEQLADGLLETESFRGQETAVIEPESVVEACQILKETGFNFLAALTAIDHWPEEPRFAVVYRLYSLREKQFVGLKARVHGDSPELPSIEPVFPSANWHEREVFDMFGIRFSGHSDLRRILMPHEWDGHPLRKDYPLGYEEVQFTFNFDEIDERKKYAED
jgi:NADH-quinone oxidoreductase subunit C